MNPTIWGVIGPGFLNQVPTLKAVKETFRPVGDVRKNLARLFTAVASSRTLL